MATDEVRPDLASQTLDVSSETIAASRRLVESVLIAVVTSAGLYLVGSVYTDAYYGRMSIDALSLDLSPPYVTLQAAHALQGLLETPSTLLLLYVLTRILAGPLRWLMSRYDWARQRSERLVLLLTNLLVITPFVVDAILAADGRSIPGTSAVSEVTNLLLTVTLILLVFTIWLSLGPRALLFTQIRERRIIPIALVVIVYLLGALVSTSDAGERAAEVYMTGHADSSMAITLTMRNERFAPLPDETLLLVTFRNNSYFVVEMQELPASTMPVAYMIPFDVVESVRIQRVNEAGIEVQSEEMLGLDLTPEDATPGAP